MGRFDPKYTAEQKQAIVVAVTERGLTAREAVEFAASGMLEENVAPFQMPVGTAYDVCAKARRHRAKTAGKAAAVEAMTMRALTLINHELRVLERQSVDELDIARLGRAARALLPIARLSVTIDPPDDQPEDHDPPEPSDTVLRLLEAHNGTPSPDHA